MLESVFILLLVVAVILMILSISWGSMVLSTITMFMWFILGLVVSHIEIPYQAIDSSDNIVTGTHIISNLYGLNWLFVGLGLFMLFYLVIWHVFPMFKGRFNRML